MAPPASATSTAPRTTTPSIPGSGSLPSNALEPARTTTTVPPGVCPDLAQPVTLAPTQIHGVTYGSATIPSPPGLDAGTPNITISASEPLYGSLEPGKYVEALNVWCSNTGRTADGQIENSWVIYAEGPAPQSVLGTLTPQMASDTGDHVAYFDSTQGAITITGGSITTKELFYGSQDATCCPSGRAATVWAWNGRAFEPHTTVQAQPTGT